MLFVQCAFERVHWIIIMRVDKTIPRKNRELGQNSRTGVTIRIISFMRLILEGVEKNRDVD